MPALVGRQQSLDWTGLDWTGLDWTGKDRHRHSRSFPPLECHKVAVCAQEK